MANIAHDLVPDIRVIFQAAIYGAGLLAANHYFIQPLMKLHFERKKRTLGAVQSAKDDDAAADIAAQNYQHQLSAERTKLSHEKRKELDITQKNYETIVNEAEEKSKASILKATSQVKADLESEKQQTGRAIEDMSQHILKQLGLKILLAMMVLTYAEKSWAGGAAIDFMEGIFWPYVQFIIYAGAVAYLGRKPIAKILTSRRDDLRTKLSEAREATELARRKTQEFNDKLKGLEAEFAEMSRQLKLEIATEREKTLAEAHRIAAQIVKDAEKKSLELITEARAKVQNEIVFGAIQKVEERLKSADLSSLDATFQQEIRDSSAQFAAHA